MGCSLYVSTTEAGSGKALVALGMLNLILRKTTNVSFFRPVIQTLPAGSVGSARSPAQDEDIELILRHFGLRQSAEASFGLLAHQANELVSQHKIDQVIAVIIEKFKALESRSDFILCEGSDYLGEGSAFAYNLNQEIAKNLGCPILILGNADHRSVDAAIRPVQAAAETYQKHNCQIAGIVLNKAAPDQVAPLNAALKNRYGEAGYVLALIPYERKLSSPRVQDIAQQLIKAKPGVSLVSSVFLMYLGDHVRVYGDCAVNPNPNAAQLAKIAIASAETAQSFGIEPRVALRSYSSGESAQGEEVDKVRAATHLARQQRPDLSIEGPIQYDAAVDPAVAAHKLPGSAVGGRATVLIFPDLNTGNNTYKAVQRETGAIAIGPILQGLKKPVNDLSRGCTVEDIINTVVITAIQAQAATVG